MSKQTYDLDRFINAQNHAYEDALAEIRQGQKRGHWMWYIFPQIAGLGRSEIAVYYSIADSREAVAYMNDALLRSHLLEISEALLHTESSDPEYVMGHPDDLKLQSCMTLFAETAPEEPVFQKVLDKFYDGKKDRKTIEILHDTSDLRKDAHRIIEKAIRAVRPDAAVVRALKEYNFSGKIVLVAIGKAGWEMARAAVDVLKDSIDHGVVITKYGHAIGELPKIRCYEAGHPVPDENSFLGTQAAIDAVQGLTEKDTVLFLVSGGGSALFEKPLVETEELQNITGQLLACGADIVEINTIRKRLSAVKGGRFARLCAPARVFAIVLSDVLGDPLDMIASGPACPDRSTCEEAEKIVKKYHLTLSDEAKKLLAVETPKKLDNVDTQITGSVRELCRAAASSCKELGYEPVILTDQLCCQAREAGSFLASICRTYAGKGEKLAYIAGGETVVKLTGKGKGGRNQELALAAADGLDGLGAAVFSVGSDGTDGPTDAAGGYSDGNTKQRLKEAGYDISEVLENNDSYHALKAVKGLVITGPTGTNVNDVAVALIKG